MRISEIFFSPKRALLRMIFLIISVVLLFWLFFQNFTNKNQTEYIFLIDNSLSMSVQDIASETLSHNISRLDFSKNFVEFFIKNFSPSVGLATFTESLVLVAPITDNSSHISASLTGISPILYGGGSDIFRSISTLSEMYKTHKNLHIIVLTDTEFFDKNTENFSPKNALKISIIGVGTERGGTMLLAYNTDWKPIYKEFDGKNAISVFSPKALSEIASFFSADSFHPVNESDFPVISEKIFSKNFHNSEKNIWIIVVTFFLFIIIIFPIYRYKKS